LTCYNCIWSLHEISIVKLKSCKIYCNFILLSLNPWVPDLISWLFLYFWNHISLIIFNLDNSLLKYSGPRFRIINSHQIYLKKIFHISLIVTISKWLWIPYWKMAFPQCYMWSPNTLRFCPWKISLRNVSKGPTFHI